MHNPVVYGHLRPAGAGCWVSIPLRGVLRGSPDLATRNPRLLAHAPPEHSFGPSVLLTETFSTFSLTATGTLQRVYNQCGQIKWVNSSNYVWTCNHSALGGGSTRNRSLWETVFIWTAQATCPVEASAKMDACAFLACCAKAVAWLQQSKATPYSFQPPLTTERLPCVVLDT